MPSPLATADDIKAASEFILGAVAVWGVLKGAYETWKDRRKRKQEAATLAATTALTNQVKAVIGPIPEQMSEIQGTMAALHQNVADSKLSLGNMDTRLSTMDGRLRNLGDDVREHVADDRKQFEGIGGQLTDIQAKIKQGFRLNGESHT